MQKNSFEPTLLTIFGITGDLSRQRLLPALYHLEKSHSLPKHLFIVGVSRRKLTVHELSQTIRRQLAKGRAGIDVAALRRLTNRFRVVHIQITEAKDYSKLKLFLDSLEAKQGICFNRLFYLSIPPMLFAPVVEKLGAGELHKGCTKHQRMESRILIEKPFGYDLDSAQELIERIGRYFREKQVYRIDHYLAKETVQNIIQFRFQNPLIDAIWNNYMVDHVQITFAEKIGIGSRVNFFEQTGILRDIVQSHMLQLMALVAMERPASLTAGGIHKARAELLKSIDPIKPNQVARIAVRGQYTAAKGMKGYKQEVDNSKSAVETYAAVKLSISNGRWIGVPFIIRAGKRMDKEVTTVTLVFKDRTRRRRPANTLTMRIDPDEGIILDLLVKKPGLTNETQQVEMNFLYSRSFSGAQLSAYERLLVDALAGDRTLFTTSNDVLYSWQVIQPILHEWQNSATSLEYYPAGSSGAAGADALVKRYGCEWLDLAETS